jgi:hypothetical protein
MRRSVVLFPLFIGACLLVIIFLFGYCNLEIGYYFFIVGLYCDGYQIVMIVCCLYAQPLI